MTPEQLFKSACTCAIKAEEYEKSGMMKIAAFARRRASELLQDAILLETGWRPGC